jgi:hypothetical protein
MLIHKYRFVETTGEGGDSNPCVKPLFDVTMAAPPKAAPKGGGRTGRKEDMLSNADRNALTTGQVHSQRYTLADARDVTTSTISAKKAMEGLFEPPSCKF